MLAVWLVLLTRLGGIPLSPRQRRFEIGQMSAKERLWSVVCLAFVTGLIAWLNAAATVDWGPLSTAISAGKVGPILLAVALAAYVAVMVAGIVLSWRKESGAYAARLSS